MKPFTQQWELCNFLINSTNGPFGVLFEHDGKTYHKTIGRRLWRGTGGERAARWRWAYAWDGK